MAINDDLQPKKEGAHDVLTPLREASAHVKGVLLYYESVKKALPSIVDMDKRIDWVITSLEQAPPEALSVVTPPIMESVERDCRNVSTALPMARSLAPSAVQNCSNSTLSVTNTALSCLSTMIFDNRGNAAPFARGCVEAYSKLQTESKQEEKVRELVARLGEDVLGRFERARTACVAAHARVEEQTAAALQMRTLLDGVKGILWTRVRKSNEQNCKWGLILSRLVVNDPSGIATKTMIEQERVAKGLYQDLSAVAKDRPIIIEDIDLLWTRVLEFLFLVLNSVQPVSGREGVGSDQL